MKSIVTHSAYGGNIVVPSAPKENAHVTISVDDLETLAHGVEFARRVAHDLHVLFNDPAMARTQERIREAQKEAMRLVGLARSPK